MTNTVQKPDSTTSGADPFVAQGRVLKIIGCSSSSHNIWIREGRFPPPDANIFGRRMWLLSTVMRWREDALSGQFSRTPRSFFRAHQEAL